MTFQPAYSSSGVRWPERPLAAQGIRQDPTMDKTPSHDRARHTCPHSLRWEQFRHRCFPQGHILRMWKETTHPDKSHPDRDPKQESVSLINITMR